MNMNYDFFQTSGLTKQLPENVHILTLEMIPPNPLKPISFRQAILRLEHVFENGEDEMLSKPATVDLVSYKFFLQFYVYDSKYTFIFL